MLFRTILVCLFGFTLVKFAKIEALAVDFQITLYDNTLYCDKQMGNIDSHQYSVWDGDDIDIMVNYKKTINDIRCTSLYDKMDFIGSFNMYHNVSTIKVKEIMNTTWNCLILTHKESASVIKRVVHVDGVSYSAVDCVIQIHVLNKLPQEILINNIPLGLVRDTTSTELDFTGVYEYGDDDVFEVICRNTIITSDLDNGQLDMQYSLTDPSRRVYISNQSSHLQIGFRAKFTYRDNSSSIKCIYQINKHARAGVQVKFIYRSKFDNLIKVKVNGLTFRLINPKIIQYPYYEFNYMVYIDEKIFLECEIEDNNLKLQFVQMKKINNARQLKPDQKRIGLESKFRQECRVRCVAEQSSQTKIEETVEIHFIDKKENYQLNVDLPPENILWEFYENKNKKTIYYGFGTDMYLNISCTATYVSVAPVLYIKFGDSEESAKKISTKQIHLSLEDRHIVCYLKSQTNTDGRSAADPVLKEIQIYFVRFDPTTTTSSTTPAYSGDTSAIGNMATTPAPNTGQVEPWLFAVAGSVMCVVIICVTTVIFRLKKSRRLQGGPNNPEYVNLQGTSEASIPAYPSQWEGNYAVPADHREDSVTYCVPYRPEGAVYSVPIPKAERKKKLNKESTHNTYSNIQNVNKTTRSDDPNYAVVLPKKKEQCYAQVLPKAQRMARESSPYSYVTGPRPLDVTDENRSGQDELYCELNARNH